MSAGDMLAAIARGERPAALLHTARLVGDVGEVYGSESIAAHFRAAPLTLVETIADDRGIVGVAEGELLFVDRYDDHVARLWRVGARGSFTIEPGIDVGFDPDMAQAGGDVASRPEDFACVAAGWHDRVVETARDALAGSTSSLAGVHRRLFVLRIVATRASCAALFAMAEQVRFRHIGLLLDDCGARWFSGAATPARVWTPRA